jgi:5,10-methylenetetrahydrofolate reductase
VKTQIGRPRLFSFEFFPPKSPEGVAKLRATRKQLAQLNPAFFSVTYGAGGSTREGTLSTVLEIRGEATRPRRTVSCIASTRAQLGEGDRRVQGEGHQRVVALRGDLPSGIAMAGELRYASDLVAFIRERTGDWFHIEVAAYPEYHPQHAARRTTSTHSRRRWTPGPIRRSRSTSTTRTRTSTSSTRPRPWASTCRSSRHHADQQFLAARALLGCVRRGDPALDAH